MAKRNKSELTKLKEKAQKLFNFYIRERDKGQPCISCGEHKERPHAGHYFPVIGYAHMRFHPDNVHIQCSGCNTYKKGNIHRYRKALGRKLGNDRLLRLEEYAFKAPEKITEKEEKEELKLIIQYYETYKKTGKFPKDFNSLASNDSFDIIPHTGNSPLGNLRYYRS